MVWESEACVILMLVPLEVDGKRKCQQYWPGAGKDAQNYGDIVVTSVAEVATPYGFERTFQVTRNNLGLSEGTRAIKQWHFTSWPKGRKSQDAQATTSVLSMFKSVQVYQESLIVMPPGTTNLYVLVRSCPPHLWSGHSNHHQLLPSAKHHLI